MRLLLSVQVLRALAASLVVVYHVQVDSVLATGFSPDLPDLTVGAAGVDIFFVISGFIMVYTSEAFFGRAVGSRTFLIRRLVRICPLYWAVSVFQVLVWLIAPSLFTADFSSQMILASLLFWPMRRPDGTVAPVVAQGWTLNYEMFFYLVFAVAVLSPPRRAVLSACITLLAITLAGRLAPLPFPLSYWANPIILDFVAGLVLGLAYREGVRLGWMARATIIGAGMLVFALFPPVHGEELLDGGYRSFALWGAPATLIVAGAVLGEPTAKITWTGRVLSRLGDASYALYLTHHIPIRAIRRLTSWLGVNITSAPWLYVSVVLVVATLAALVVFVAFERPVARLLSGRLRRGASPPSRHQSPD